MPTMNGCQPTQPQARTVSKPKLAAAWQRSGRAGCKERRRDTGANLVDVLGWLVVVVVCGAGGWLLGGGVGLGGVVDCVWC